VGFRHGCRRHPALGPAG
jgi:hypothetical protein